MTSPVERISGESKMSWPWKRLKGKTDSFTAQYLGQISSVNPSSFNVFPAITFAASLARGKPMALLTNGTVRAETAARIPIIRMTNINLEPGTTPLADIIAGTKRGIFVDTNKSWSIDDLRLNFQFGCEIAYEIEDGRLGRILRNPLYTGTTPDFWRSCDAVADRDSWQIWGLPNCGKGDPMQTMRVAHGAPAARFRNVEMG